MRWCWSLVILCIPLVAQADEKLKGIACRSVHLGYPGKNCTAFYNEVQVQRSAPGSYFMVCGWDKGYYGIQEQAGGKKLLIFSVWDSGQNDKNKVPEEKRTKLLYQDKAMRIGRFGGEGTGGQSFYDYDWKLNTTYRFLVTANLNGDRTEYTGYFFHPEEHVWKKLVTFSTVTGSKLMSGFYSFVEDFKRDRVSATKIRQARFGHGWILPQSGPWMPVIQARFTGDGNPVENISAGLDDDWYFLATGGDTAMKDVRLKDTIKRRDTGKLEVPKDVAEVVGR